MNNVNVQLHCRPRPSAPRGHVRVVLVVGGSRAILRRYSRIYNADILVNIDVHREVDRHPHLFADDGFSKSFELAMGETSASLLAPAYGAVHGDRYQGGRVNGTDGLGAHRQLGHAAAIQLTQKPEFQRAMRQLVDEVQIRAAGCPTSIEFIGLGSTPGGTAGGGLPVITECIAKHLATIGVAVTTKLDLIGTVTYLGLGDRIARNGAAMLLDSLKWLVDASAPDLLVKQLQVTEFPPLRNDSRLRDEWTKLDHQALVSSELQQRLKQIEPNHAADSRFGNAVFRRFSCWNSLPQDLVARDIARIYGPQIRAALDSAHAVTASVASLDLPRQVEALPRDPVEELVDQFEANDEESFLGRVSLPGWTIGFEVTAVMQDGDEYRLEEFSRYFHDSPQSLLEAHRRLQLMRSLRAVLAHRLGQIEDELLIREDERQKAEQHLRKAWRAMAQHYTGGGLFSWLANPEKDRDRLIERAEKYRTICDAIQELQCRQMAMLLAITRVEEQLQKLTTRLESLDSMLDRQKKQAVRAVKTLVMARPVNEAFSDLYAIDERPGETTELLAAQAAAVTLDGLAQIVGVNQPRFETIVHKVLQQPAIVEGPYLGGATRGIPSQVAYVFPAMAAEHETHLIDLMNDRAPGAMVSFTDGCGAGANAVRYEFYRFRSAKAFFVGTLERELKAAMEESGRDLFFPAGVNAEQVDWSLTPDQIGGY